ncbi:MAG: retropepsin-like aspartic protease [Candidatus Bathyarchaeia archaeon]
MANQGVPDPMQQDAPAVPQPAPPPVALTQEQQAITELFARIEALERLTTEQRATIDEQREQLNARRNKEKGEIVRPKKPNNYDGNPNEREKYFNEVETYFGYFDVTLADDEDKVHFAASCLEGAAEEWFRPYMKDWNTNSWTDLKEETRHIFESYKNYKEELVKAFGTSNERQEAEKQLQSLIQKGPLFKHTATFIRLLQKVNWTEESKKERYYMSVKPEVKDELFRLDRDEMSFAKFTEEAIKIDNRQYERKQERKMEKSGSQPRFQPQANQKKRRDEYIAKDNGTKPGRMDIDAINRKKFPGTCNACGKKGHKEADCRSKITCGFCGKKGHDEAHCYTKKNKKNFETTKDKVQINAITEIPHDHLSWTACYNDSCLVHQSSKEGSGYYPKKPRAKKAHKTITIDTLNFRDGNSDFSAEPLCEYCWSSNPHCDCQGKRLAVWKEHYICDDCKSRDPDHTCTGCPDCGSLEFPHECEAEWRRNMEAMCELFEEEDRLAKEHLEEQEKTESKVTFKDVYDSNDSDDDECHQCGALEPRHNTTCSNYVGNYGCPLCMSEEESHQCTGCVYCRSMKIPHLCDVEIRKKVYECEVCESTDLDHDCEGCRTCGSHDPKHDCMYVLGEQAEKQEEQEELRRYLDENPPQQINIEEVRNYYPQKHISRIIREAFDENCGKLDWMLCDSMYCQKHAFDKLEDWHDQQIEDQLFKEECTKEHFLDCEDLRCTKHAMIKYRFRLLTRALTKKGYNTITHTHKGHGNKGLIKEFHSMIEERIYDIKCKWCYKYQGKTWRESHLGRITIDSIGSTKNKLMVKGYINQHPVTTYVDSGADRNLITPQMVNLLGLPYVKKKQPTYVSTVAIPNAEATINYETDHLPITIAGHTETIKFDIMPLGTCDVLLGHPWLKQGNPLINWKTKEILWDTDVTQEL